ncbi:hypothetical protein BT96DRAFT_990914 [Gymnopus androsaceus JB14]|uniref:Zn(2)-C6 fungal-type domain-containing protein n=1 Tax=Gymnopus androsaceus JB14 TaxID=1447944 RepID=A0A6A4HY47_9AGAR|nr:hypothetical protein BT96DRAFT_990914 [Gymnopus androsaceus JB14]
MPAVATSTKSSRRKEKHLTPEELKDIEQKRLKGLVSCAECRRLKLRCDKKVPCSSCCRRGCESICPCGILEAGVGTRFILASTTQLHSKIALMSSRIRALGIALLEDAVAIFQASVSSERHPLLEDDLLKIKFGSEALQEPEDPSQEGGSTIPGDASSSNRSADTTTLDAFGTLTLGEEGEMRYFGRSAGSETLILAGERYADSSSDEEQGSDHADDTRDTSEPGPTSATHTLPFTDQDKDTVPSEVYALALDNAPDAHSQSSLTVTDLLKHLPPRSRADALAQSYIDHASLFFRAMKRDELFETILPTIYSSLLSGIPDAAADGSVPPTSLDTSESQHPDTGSVSNSNPSLPSPHLLSTIFFVFSLGSFFDLSSSVKKYVSESELWFQLGRKALICSRGIIDIHHHPIKTSVGENTPSPGRQLSDDEMHGHDAFGSKDRVTFAAPPSSVEDTIRALGLMATYCSMSGKKYARDSAWCGMSLAAKIAQGSGMHRDPARWHMDPTTVAEETSVMSVALGRPPSIHLSFVDCEFPTDEEATLSDTGEEVMGFWRMKYTFAMKSFTPVISTTLTAKSPTYSTIMDLDRKIRELTLPPGFKPYVSLHEDGEEIYHNSHLALRDFYASQHRTVTMLYLHRSFFAHAMLTHPSNPLMSPFAPSFLAAYRAASVIIKAAIHFYDRCPAVVPRVWFLTYHVFSAAVTVGTVVKRSPNSSIARSALIDLGQALDLFEKCANSSSRNRIACALLRKLKEQADRAYTDYLTNSKDSISTSTSGQTASSATTPSSAHSNTSASADKPQTQLDMSLFSDEPQFGTDDESLAMWGGQTRLLNGLGKKTKGKDSLRHNSRRSLSAGSPSSSADSPSTTLSAAAPLPPQPVSASQQCQQYPSSSRVNADVGNTDASSSSLPQHSWHDVMDAQMNFDTNLDLPSMNALNSMFPISSLSSMQMPPQPTSTDVTMTEAPLSSFNNVDFGFRLGELGFGAGTTGSRGLLMDMAMEDIGPVASLGGSSSSSSYDRAFDSASNSKASDDLMEYLSGTAEAASVPFPSGGVLPFGSLRGGSTNAIISSSFMGTDSQ